MTITQAIRRYLEREAALGASERTIENHRSRLRSFVATAKKRRMTQVRDLSVDIARAHHDRLLEQGLGSSTRLSYMSTIRSFLHWCHESRYILTDVAGRIELPALERSLPPTPLPPHEVATLMDLVSTATVTGKRDRAMLEVLYASGLRRDELLALNVGDIDFVERTVFVRKGKGDKDRVIPIHDTALKAITGYLSARGGRPRKNSPLFVTHWNDGRARQRFNRHGMTRLFRYLNDRFPKHVHPHLLRHSFAVHLLQGGADVRYVQALLGHESPDTTSRYLGLVKDELKRAYDDAIEAMLGR